MLFLVAICKGMVVAPGNSEARKIRFRVKIHGKPRYIAKLVKKNPIKDGVHMSVQTAEYCRVSWSGRQWHRNVF